MTHPTPTAEMVPAAIPTLNDMIGMGAYMARVIEQDFATYGVRPECRRCPEKCHQYNAQLTRFVCRRSPEFQQEEMKLNGNRIDAT